MNVFNRLPGFTRTPPGLERVVLRVLPRTLLLGTLALGLPSLVARLWPETSGGADAARQVAAVDILAIGVLVVFWTAALTAAIASFIVMVMKGPAYVADAYPLSDSDAPQPSRPR